jgi:hypothetical protein
VRGKAYTGFLPIAPLSLMGCPGYTHAGPISGADAGHGTHEKDDKRQTTHD